MTHIEQLLAAAKAESAKNPTRADALPMGRLCLCGRVAFGPCCETLSRLDGLSCASGAAERASDE